MKSFPDQIKFKFPWRKYQKRVLDELQDHLSDDHLHIIAPPGSGKTILGLEVALRINKPTLIFAPTTAIRNQWVQRFCEMFLQTETVPSWISKDIRQPGFLTVSTYQGLHSAFSGAAFQDEEDDEVEEEELSTVKVSKEKTLKAKAIISNLKKKGIGTIVVDEAHHLKSAWWQSLTRLKNELEVTVVGLTATPPYDVSFAEWQRYIELNGPVDSEISVPELVVEGDLCPHQDYIFFSRPTKTEQQKIDAYRDRIEALFMELKQDELLAQALEQHLIYTDPLGQLDWIYNNLEYYSATLVYLNSIGKFISNDHLEIIGDRKIKIPKLNYEWIEILLTFYLYQDPEGFSAYEDHQKNLLNKLKRNSAIERRAINFRNNRKINSFLSSSISKLESIDSVVDFEYSNLKEHLRMVVLTDYIRKEFLVNGSRNDLELNRIGVMPIFEKLRRTNGNGLRIGVLTGSLVILPVAALEAFQGICKAQNIPIPSGQSLPYDGDYLMINPNAQIKSDLVHIITEVFEKGHIQVLVGTKSLLGEGWDAPSINALILASFVGSYVSSNQMRGRAIRTERKNLDKTGNIWHLICMDPSSSDGGDDYKLMERRFRAFVGVSHREEIIIESGIGRLVLPERLRSQKQIEEVNNLTMSRAARRDTLKEQWHDALESGRRLVEEIKVPFPKERNFQKSKSFYLRKTIAYAAGMLASSITAFSEQVIDFLNRMSRHIHTPQDFYRWLFYIGLVALALFGRATYKTFKMFIKHRDIAKDLHFIADALLESLAHVGVIHTDMSKLRIVCYADDLGAVYCHLEGGSTFEKSAFIEALHEIVSPIENPRYLIIRKSLFIKVISQKDYHSVPEVLGKRKASASHFEAGWRKHVGRCKLVFTRNVEGRKILLRSRLHSLASEFQHRSERINIWR